MALSSKNESDIILNRASVALARSQRLVASWLPEKTPDELANAKSEEELQREEDEIFTAVPETLGVGAPLPEKAADGSWNRTELSSNDALRKQLLGRNYDKFMKAKQASAAEKQAAAKGGVSALAGKTAASGSGSAAAGDDEEDDEEEGRVSMVGKKRRRKIGQASAAPAPAAAGATTTGNAEDAGGKAGNGMVETGPTAITTETAKLAPAKGRKKTTSYLDELLAERSKKRKKR